MVSDVLMRAWLFALGLVFCAAECVYVCVCVRVCVCVCVEIICNM